LGPGPGGPVGGPESVPKEPQEESRNRSGSEKGCKSKGRCGLCLRKGKKRRKMNQSKGVLAALRDPGVTLGAQKWALLSPRGAQGGQKDRTRSNWCIKERKK
jgi:hypothetical protein